MPTVHGPHVCCLSFVSDIRTVEISLVGLCGIGRLLQQRTMSPRKGKRNARGRSFRENKTYAVEKILKCRTNGGKVEYYVKWVGYDNFVNSWEPEENFVEVRIGEREWVLIVCRLCEVEKEGLVSVGGGCLDTGVL